MYANLVNDKEAISDHNKEKMSVLISSSEATWTKSKLNPFLTNIQE